MLLWFVLAALTAVAIVAVSLPLLRARHSGQNVCNMDAAVYRAQLREIDAEEERGVLNAQEAESARIEVSRRLLRAAEAKPSFQPHASTRSYTGALALGLALAVPAAALTLYLAFGSPELPGQPLAARLADPSSEQRIAALVAKVEERLRLHPEDGAGWDVIAPVYFRMQRFEDAADAYSRAIRLNGESAERLEGLGEALVMANNGIVSEKARAAFASALSKDPGLPKSQFWLAMAHEQEGRFEDAARGYKALLDKSPPDAPWRELVAQRLRLVEARLALHKQGDAPGPSADDVRAMQDMTPEQRLAMINRMVEGLAARLKADGSDLKGWLRLMRAYMVLGRTDAARQAAAEARRNFAGDDKALAQIDAAAKELGLGS